MDNIPVKNIKNKNNKSKDASQETRHDTEFINIIMNKRQLKANAGETLLSVAQKNGIHIPTLCFHEKIKPHGACRLCLVEIKKGSRIRIVASCAYTAEEGLEVFTESPRVEEIRKHLTELYLAMYPYHTEIKQLAKKYGLKNTRFKKVNDYCILCGLCVRYCAEVKGYNAIGFVGRGVNKKVTFIPDSAYFKYCVDCMECANICPTGVFPSNYGIEKTPQLSGS